MQTNGTNDRPLDPFERWMVESNVQTARDTGVTLQEQAAILRANGYDRVAAAVEASDER